VTFVAAALFGSLLGFLRYNVKNATLFLGNNGAFVLGYIVAIMMVMTGWSSTDPFKSIIIPCSILVVPLYDITLSTILRLKNGVVRNVAGAITYCGKDHISHRLMALGFSRGGVLAILCSLGILGGLVGATVYIARVGWHIYVPLTVAATAVLFAFGAYLDKAAVYDRTSNCK
jgi:UDP-GlcNAc:undecaprenyl-phosphate GlcNAc-1-phosphate transferase